MDPLVVFQLHLLMHVDLVFFLIYFCASLGLRNSHPPLSYFFRYNFQTMLVILIFILDINVYLSIYFEDTFFNVPSSIFVRY
jgi:hypothetical protein